MLSSKYRSVIELYITLDIAYPRLGCLALEIRNTCRPPYSSLLTGLYLHVATFKYPPYIRPTGGSSAIRDPEDSGNQR